MIISKEKIICNQLDYEFYREYDILNKPQPHQLIWPERRFTI